MGALADVIYRQTERLVKQRDSSGGNKMKQSERDVQNAIVEALLLDNWMIIRCNQGGRDNRCLSCFGDGCNLCNGTGKGRYTRFAWWQVLGLDAQDSGISDVIADKQVDEVLYYQDGITGEFIPYDKEVCIHLAVEVKAPRKKTCPKCNGHGWYAQNTYTCELCGGSGKVSNKNDRVTAKQQAFLDAVEQHGGISIVADCLEDIAPYFERVDVQ